MIEAYGDGVQVDVVEELSEITERITAAVDDVIAIRAGTGVDDVVCI